MNLGKRFLVWWACAGCLFGLTAAWSQVPQPRLEDFIIPSRIDGVRQIIQRAVQSVSARQMATYLRLLTEEPHRAGTDTGMRLARWLAQQLRSYGWLVTLDSYQVFLSEPRAINLHIVGPDPVDLDLRERGDRRDKDALATTVDIPFNAYSASGTGTAQVVYVNYGTREDFARLRALGIDPTGKALLIRYGRVFRGVKVALAQEHGAAAVLLYSDPEDDGYHRGDVYPHGPWRPEWAVQRGSVLFTMLYPGDPLTPGSPAPSIESQLISPPRTTFLWKPLRPGKERSPSAVPTLPRIPVIPLSYANARKILQRLGGMVAPTEWQGGLPLTYHIGPGPAEVTWNVQMVQEKRPIWNVIAWIPGETDATILVGNHHDAWLYGAVDPSSGSAVLLEVARVIGHLVNQGYRPRRTIMLAFWDAEEYGLIGSTEFVERYLPELQKSAVLYLNVDAAVSGGQISAAATPHLRVWLELAARMIEHPLEPGTLYDHWLALRKGPDNRPMVHTLGGGSDFVAFQDHAGIAAASVQMRGAYGVYHSNVDNLYWMQRFGDPQFIFHRTMARWVVTLVLLATESDRYPMQIADYAEQVLRAIEAMGLAMENIREKSVQAAYTRAVELAQQWRDMARAMDAAGRDGVVREDLEAIRRWNTLARSIDFRFLTAQGLPGRPWYRHLIFSPARYGGYDTSVLPAIREALEARDAAALQEALRQFHTGLQRQIQAMRRR